MKALFIIDMLNDFVMPKGSLYVMDAEKIIPRIAKLLSRFRRADFPVFYVNDSHSENDEEFKVWPKHAVKGTRGADVIAALKPGKEEIIIEKVTYDGFANPQLDKKLKELDVNEIYITGVITHICIKETAMSALARGYKVKVPWNCIKDIDNRKAKQALRELRKKGAKLIKPRKI